MIRRVWKWLKRALILLIVMMAGLLAPVGYVELACKGEPVESDYVAILPPEDRRPESRTLLTYPEWHIVHAYDDYARVIRDGDPHDYAYLRSISGFWSSLCALSGKSAQHGGFPWETKQMVYTIGVSFTAELLGKAAYEETLGRVATWVRGEGRTGLDDVSADQAAAYAKFLQQVPWYKWDFKSDAAELAANATDAFRDRERRFALGTEYSVKAAYAKVIEQAVAQVGADALRLRMIVTGLSAERLAALPGVEVVMVSPDYIEIETPRYRVLTGLLQDMADKGAEFVEIAGNDDILITALSGQSTQQGAIFSFARQGYGDWRHLVMIKVSDLADRLRSAGQNGLQIEHVHDY